METTLYAFAGMPSLGRGQTRGLHAGGLQYCIETVEGLAILNHDPALQQRKEGLFVVSGRGGEQISDAKIHLSDRVIQDGITDNWFLDNASFGNGVTCPKTTANYRTKIVNHECGRTLEEMLRTGGIVDLSRLRLQQVHDFTESWAQYEYRWRAGTCPQENHSVHLTVMLVQHELSASAYRRILDLVENGAEPLHPEAYVSDEPGRYFSTFRQFDSVGRERERTNGLKLLAGLK